MTNDMPTLIPLTDDSEIRAALFGALGNALDGHPVILYFAEFPKSRGAFYELRDLLEKVGYDVVFRSTSESGAERIDFRSGGSIRFVSVTSATRTPGRSVIIYPKGWIGVR